MFLDEHLHLRQPNNLMTSRIYVALACWKIVATMAAVVGKVVLRRVNLIRWNKLPLRSEMTRLTTSPTTFAAMGPIAPRPIGHVYTSGLPLWLVPWFV
jgi:hypothetical protein